MNLLEKDYKWNLNFDESFNRWNLILTFLNNQNVGITSLAPLRPRAVLWREKPGRSRCGSQRGFESQPKTHERRHPQSCQEGCGQQRQIANGPEEHKRKEPDQGQSSGAHASARERKDNGEADGQDGKPAYVAATGERKSSK